MLLGLFIRSTEQTYWKCCCPQTADDDGDSDFKVSHSGEIDPHKQKTKSFLCSC